MKKQYKTRINHLLAAAASVILLTAVLSGCGKEKPKLKQTDNGMIEVNAQGCMQFVPVGYNGGGNLQINWDFSGTSVSLNAQQKEFLEKAPVALDPNPYYKDGDRIKVCVEVYEDDLAALNLKLTDGEFTFKAEGFPKEVDPFESLSLPLTGLNGEGIIHGEEMKYDTASPFFSSLRFETQKSSELSNGDEVKVKAIVDEELAKTYGLKPTRLEKTFTISGLGRPAKTIEELDTLLEPIGEGSRKRMLRTMCNFSFYSQLVPGVEPEKEGETPEPFTVRTCDLAAQYLGHMEPEHTSFYESVIVNIYRMTAEDPAAPQGREFYISMAYEAPPANAQPTEWAKEQMKTLISYHSYEPGELLRDISFLTDESPEKLWEKIKERFHEDYVFTQKDYSLLSPEESFQKNPVNMNQAPAPLYEGEREGYYYVEGIGYIRNGVKDPEW